MIVDRSRPAERVAEHHHRGRGVTRIGYPIGVRRARVSRRELITPHMLRLTLAGDELVGFHSYVADDHVKLVFPLPEGTRNDPIPTEDGSLDWRSPKPPTRHYTVRRVDRDGGEIDIDVVLHDGGLASSWAATGAEGDEIVVAGPPGAKAFGHTYAHYVFAVDPTGLPAVARWLDEADWLAGQGATATVLADHDHAEETTYPLRQRDGVTVTWLSRRPASRLADAVMALDVSDDTFLFVASEFGDIQQLRAWAKARGIDAHLTGYWKRGVAGLDD